MIRVTSSGTLTGLVFEGRGVHLYRSGLNAGFYCDSNATFCGSMNSVAYLILSAQFIAVLATTLVTGIGTSKS